MSYQFTSVEPVGLGIRRIVREEIAFAQERLQVTRARERDEAVHDVRKSVKRVRALLNLVRPALGEVCEKEARAWRGLGRIFSAQRDAGAILKQFEELRAECPKRLYGEIRRNLVVSKREITRRLEPVMAKAATGLERAGTRLEAWPADGDGFRMVAPGWERTYRQGRRALRAAKDDASAGNLHKLRRRAKEHFFHLQLVCGNANSNWRRLDKTLGTHQNLVVLRRKILERPAADVEGFLTVLDKTERKLAAKGLDLGARVYRKTTAREMEKLKRRWKQSTFVKPGPAPGTS